MVKRFQGPPAAMQKVQAPRMQIAPGGHTGQATYIVVIKNNRFFCQAVEVWSWDFPAPVTCERVSVEGVEEDKNGFHERLGRLTKHHASTELIFDQIELFELLFDLNEVFQPKAFACFRNGRGPWLNGQGVQAAAYGTTSA